MSYSDDPENLQKEGTPSQPRARGSNSLPAKRPAAQAPPGQQPYQIPTPLDPDPAPLPDVTPLRQNPATTPGTAAQPQARNPRPATQIPTPRAGQPPAQPSRRDPQTPADQRIALTPQGNAPAAAPAQAPPQNQAQPRPAQPAPAQSPPAVDEIPQPLPKQTTAQKPATPRAEQPEKLPSLLSEPIKSEAAAISGAAASTIQVGEQRPSKKIDKDTLEFVSGTALEGGSTKDMLLDTNGLVKIYDGRTVVNGVNINVRKGEIVGLLGPNGAGKTTSFYMIVGLVPPNGGNVMFDGKDVTKLPMYKRARLGMGYLPQEESIFRKLTVEENIMAVMQTMKYSRKEKKERCEELLERFSITHIRKNLAMACSGGEKRRVTIARSLVPNPSLIMLDEPFAGVDPIAVNEIHRIVEDLRKAGLAILITDHNARQTLELVDRAYLIYEGRVLREGSKDFLVNDPVSRELYLGDQFKM